jgi:hypothetical protein
MGKRGRKSGMDDPEKVARLCYAISLGASYQDACAHAGISTVTFCHWRAEKSERADNLRKKVAEAEAEACMKALERINEDQSLSTAKWLLARRQSLRLRQDVPEVLLECLEKLETEKDIFRALGLTLKALAEGRLGRQVANTVTIALNTALKARAQQARMDPDPDQHEQLQAARTSLRALSSEQLADATDELLR